jgi:hypothetical protein
MNRRRAFISLLAGAAATWPLAAPAQQVEKVHRVGFLWDSPIVFPEATDAFRQGLRDLGYIEGRRPRLEPTDDERGWERRAPKRGRRAIREILDRRDADEIRTLTHAKRFPGSDSR